MTSTFDTPVIRFDTPCRRCGYSLRGLGEDSACPECGGAVAASVWDGALFRCDPAWVARVAAALRGIWTGTLAYFVANIAWALLASVAPLPMAAIMSLYYVMLVVETAVVLWLARAHWRFAERPPDGIAGSERARSVYRAAVAVVAAAKVASVLFVVVPGTGPLASPAQWAGNLALVVGTGAFWVWMRDLARRVPSDRLTRAAGALLWGNTGALAVFVAAAGLLVLRQHFGWEWGLRVGGRNFLARLYPELPVGVVAGIAVLGTGIAGLVLVHRMAKLLAARAVRTGDGAP